MVNIWMFITRMPRTAKPRSTSSDGSRSASAVGAAEVIRGSLPRLWSERSRHAEDVLAEIREDQIRGDRRHLIEACFPELALDVVLRGKAEAAERLQAGVRRFPRGVGSEELGQVGFG